MPTELIEMDPCLKFATGMLKGRPLNSTGMNYRIIRRNDESVALFANGSMARFYRDPQPPVIELEPNPLLNVQTVVDEHGPREATSEEREQCNADFKELLTKGNSPSVANALEANSFFAEVAAQLKSPYPRRTICGYRHADGSKPVHQCEPIYCVLEDGSPLFNVDVRLVGAGLREYLWLYETLREHGRGRLAAAREAWRLYFL